IARPARKANPNKVANCFRLMMIISRRGNWIPVTTWDAIVKLTYARVRNRDRCSINRFLSLTQQRICSSRLYTNMYGPDPSGRDERDVGGDSQCPLLWALVRTRPHPVGFLSV